MLAIITVISAVHKMTVGFLENIAVHLIFRCVDVDIARFRVLF
jgi:hypothetical protein